MGYTIGKYIVIVFFLLGMQFFSMQGFAEPVNIGITFDQEALPTAADSQSNMDFHISFSGPTGEEIKNATVTLLINDCNGKKLDVVLTKTEDKTITDPSGGQYNNRTCTFTGFVPIGEKYTIHATVHIGNQQVSQSREFDVYIMRHISGTIRLPDNELAANPIECSILFLNREELAGDKAVDPLPTVMRTVIPEGANKVDYQYDYPCNAFRDPVVIDCRISGDNRYTEDNFYTGDSNTPYWYQATQLDVSAKDSAGVDFTLTKAKQISGKFTLPKETARSGPTLQVKISAFSDMGTQDDKDDITIEKNMVFNYGESNDYTLVVPDGSSNYIISYHLPGYYDSYPYVYNGIPTGGYYNSTGIKQLKVYAEKISLTNGNVDGIDFKPAAYDYNGLKDVETHWANPYIYEMVARGIFGTKGSANTFKPDDYVTRGECAETAAKLFGLDETASIQIFSDVKPNNPYFKSISAAYHSGLIKGYPGGNFNPDGLITHQDAEVILYRGIVGYFKLDPNKIKYIVAGDPLSISDKDKISPYAYDAVSLCFKYYINMFRNDDKRSNPQNKITRSGLASEFYRCLKFLDSNLH